MLKFVCCLKLQCLSPREILEVHNVTADKVTSEDLERILPAIIYNLQQDCDGLGAKESDKQSSKPSSSQGD